MADKKKKQGGRPANWQEICMARVPADKATKPLKAEELPKAKKAKK